MPMNRREFLAASAASAALLNQGVRAFAAPASNIQVTIDASKVGAPVNPMVFGGYMEPATTGVWAEMLSDRKFAKPVVAAKPAPANRGYELLPRTRRALPPGRPRRNRRNGHRQALRRQAQPARQA